MLPPIVGASQNACLGRAQASLRTCSPSLKFMNTLSVPAALTSIGLRGVICGSRLFEMITFASASGFYFSHAQLAHKASSRGGRSTGKATPAHPTSCGVRHPRLCSSLKPPLRSSTQLHRFTVRRAEPNPSFKPSPNSVPRRPASAGPAAHHALAGQRVTLSVPA